MRKTTTLLLAPDTLFMKTPDGKYWSDTIYSYKFFERYLDVFDKVIIASRCKNASYKDVKGYLRSDGVNIEIREMPALQGMSSYIRNIVKFYQSAKEACKDVDCAIFRLPSVPAAMVLFNYQKLGLPYALEVVADPYEAYASNTIARYLFSYHLKYFSKKADGVSYVTKYYLQSKYPSAINLNKKGRFESYYSTINLDNNYFVSPRDFTGKKSFSIIHTANNMNNNVKGHEVLLRAVDFVLKKGYVVNLTFVGDGILKNTFEDLAVKLGIKEQVRFTGMLSNSDEVRAELLKADIFVFPTKAEGLPRSLIEAMAVGLPCISTPIAGIPELLANEDMIEPTNISGFSKRIIEFISDTKLLNEKSRRNIEVAKNYRGEILREKRREFYNNLKSITK